MITPAVIAAHIDEMLEATGFPDACHNGVQVAGDGPISRLATAASASLASCAAAVAAGCQALLCHHGLIFAGVQRIDDPLRRRLATLLAGDCALLAYHLPLDAHPRWGNNALIAQHLAAAVLGGIGTWHGRAIGVMARLPQAQPVADLSARCQALFDHPVLHCPSGSEEPITTLAIVSGSGASCLAEASQAGCQALITGEVHEQHWHEARELGCHILACGHHATEDLAIHHLGTAVADHFGLTHIALPGGNPL